MTKKTTKFDRGVKLKPEDLTTTPLSEQGELATDSNDDKLKYRGVSSTDEVVLADETQTVTNKTIDVDNNTITNIETDNLKAGVLVTTISAATSDTELPSALAVKTALEGQNEASEITYDPAGNPETSATDVQAALDDTGTAVGDHKSDATGAHAGSAISNTPSGNLAATDVQGALDELQTDVDTRALDSDLTAHETDAVGAHAASAISNVPAGNLAATDIQGAVDELQTDIDTGDTNLTNHAAATTTHGVTGDIVGTTGLQTIQDKVIDNSNSITGPTVTSSLLNQCAVNSPTQSDVKKDTQANLETYAATATNGQLCFATDTKIMYQVLDSALATVGGSGSGGINYIENSEYELNIDGIMDDFPFVASHETTSPLRGLGSLKIAKAAFSPSGAVVDWDNFTVAETDLAKKLTMTCDKDFSEMPADGDLEFVIFQLGGGGVIARSPIRADKTTHIFQFQTDAVADQYYLSIEPTNSDTTAYDFYIDNVVIGPRVVASSAFMTDEQDLSVSLTNMGNAVVTEARYSRVGDVMNGTIKITTGSTAPTGSLVVSLDNFTMVDKSNNLLGFASGFDGGSAHGGQTIQSGDSDFNFYGDDGSGIWNATAPFTWSNGDLLSFNFSVPIQGWSANATSSEDLGNRDVYANVTMTSTQSITVSTPVTVEYDQIQVDSTASFDVGTYKYLVPETGRYVIECSAQLLTVVSTEHFRLSILRNASTIIETEDSGENTQRILETAITYNLVKGDLIHVEVDSSGDIAYSVNNSSTRTHFAITKLASPQVILETETVAASYTSENGQSLSNGVTLAFEEIVYDTHGAYNVSTGEYTVPTSGLYRMKVDILAAQTVTATTEFVFLEVNVDAVAVKRKERYGNGANIYLTSDVEYEAELEKGDVITITQDTNNAGMTMQPDSKYNSFTIHRIK